MHINRNTSIFFGILRLILTLPVNHSALDKIMNPPKQVQVKSITIHYNMVVTFHTTLITLMSVFLPYLYLKMHNFAKGTLKPYLD